MPIGAAGGSGLSVVHSSAHLSDDQTQSIAIVNTPQVIEFNTHDDVPTNLTHSVTVDNSEITFQIIGRYSVGVALEVHNGSGSGTLYAWVEHSLDGITWTAVANSAVVSSLSANTENVLTLIELYDVATVGDKIRVRM
jgi:hypothetical protein